MKTSFSRKATCIQILCFLTTGCINLEWRGGMTPHFGLSESENNQTSVYPERVPFLRPISQSWSQFRGPSRNGLIPPQRFSLDFSKPPALRWVKNCVLDIPPSLRKENSSLHWNRIINTRPFLQDRWITVMRFGNGLKKLHGMTTSAGKVQDLPLLLRMGKFLLFFQTEYFPV